MKNYLFPLIALALVLIGCGDPENPINPTQHTLEINELSITSQTLEAGDTATITATVNYSGLEADLIYTWKATSGKISGDTASVTYLAPDTPGTYTITLEATDGFVVDQKSITVEVTATHSLSVGSNTYWEGKDFTQTLKYQVNVTQIFRPVKLRYEILQDQAQTGAFLSIRVNDTQLVDEAAIGSVQPAERPLIQGEVDASAVITAPGQYEVAFTLVVVKIVEHGWLLQSAKLVGAEGTAVGQ